MSTRPITSNLSTLQRAILRCEIGLFSERLSEAQRAVCASGSSSDTKSRLSTFPTSTLESREYTIIPVVACIGDRVAHPTSEANLDEFIPSSVLGDLPYQWDGRPIILDHPPLSEDANTPKSYQSRKFGLMFDTVYDFGTNKLTTNAWIDYERAREVGADYLVDKIVSGDITEVSIGVLRQLLFQTGEHNGQSYQAIWIKMVSDHLAFLHSDQIGACSVDTGCGAGRLEGVVINGIDNQEKKPMDKTIATASNSKPKALQEQLQPRLEDVQSIQTKKGFSVQGLFQRFKSFFETTETTRSDSEASLQQTKHSLYQILFDRIPGLMDVFDILPESSICLFETYRIETGYEQWAIRYQVTGDVVTVAENERPIRVAPKTVWVSVESGAAVSEDSEEAGKANQCGCDKSDKNKDTKATQEDPNESEIESKAETISTGEPKMSDDKKTTETPVNPSTTTTTTTPAVPATPPTPPAPPVAPANQSASPVNLEAYLSTAPPEIRRIVERDRANELRTRNSAIESVLANQKREIWTKERLEQLDTEILITVADSLVSDDDVQALPSARQSYNQPDNADYSGSRSSYGTTNKSVDPRDNSRSLGWGGVVKKEN